jgi:ketosteroid isomerase-like protein
MDREDVSRWLDGYVDAWRSYDRTAIVALFTEDAQYRYAPYEEPLNGAQAIADSWLEDPDDPDSWEASYGPVAIDGDTAVAVGSSRYRATPQRPARTYHNCYLLRFADDGRCRELTEWFMQEPAPEQTG